MNILKFDVAISDYVQALSYYDRYCPPLKGGSNVRPPCPISASKWHVLSALVECCCWKNSCSGASHWLQRIEKESAEAQNLQNLRDQVEACAKRQQ